MFSVSLGIIVLDFIGSRVECLMGGYVVVNVRGYLGVFEFILVRIYYFS